MMRRTKQEVAPDLRPKEYAGRKLKGQKHGPKKIWLPMSPAQEKAYKEIRQNAATQLDGGTLLADGTLPELMRLRQFSVCAGRLNSDGDLEPTLPSNKFTWLVDWLTERDMGNDGSGDSKVIVASQFTSVLELFEVELNKRGFDTLMISGRSKNREGVKRQFQSAGGPRVLLLTTTAGGVSLTLDAYADDLIFLDETWIPDDQEQVEDRIHRVSRIHRTTYWYLASIGSIEHTIATRNLAADAIQKRVLDGRRGVKLALELILDTPEEDA
jgi:SNF2 family DNA or RNA helicase